MDDLVTLLVDLGNLIGGVPGTVVRYAAAIIHAKAKHDIAVAGRIARARITGIAAGQAAYESGKVAGHESNGSGAR